MFELIKTYRVKSTTGYVYILNGRKAATFAKSLDALKTSLGVASMNPIITYAHEWAREIDAHVMTLTTNKRRSAEKLEKIRNAYRQAAAEIVSSMEQASDEDLAMYKGRLTATYAHGGQVPGYVDASVHNIKPACWGYHISSVHDRVGQLIAA